MAKGRVPPGGKAPFCADCHSADCHVVSVGGGGNVWLCGSCELIRADPEVARAAHPPGLPITWRAKPKQKERLFDQ